LMTKCHHEQDESKAPCNTKTEEMGSSSSDTASPWTKSFQFLQTTKKIIQFSSGRDPKSGDKIVYTAGAFDLFHVGLLDFLEKAKAKGDYLIVGLHTDPAVNRYKGSNYPIMNLNERVLSVLACKYVDEVVIGAPYEVTKELMEHFNIDLVVHGTTDVLPTVTGTDPYCEPKRLEKFETIDSENSITTADIVERIISHRLEYEKRNKAKEAKEIAVHKKYVEMKKFEPNEFKPVNLDAPRTE